MTAPQAMPTILAELVEQARVQTERRKLLLTAERLDELIARQAPPRDFAAALRRPPRLAVIAEMKRRTPALGMLAPRYRPGEIAREYTLAGADAISVLTHEAGFGGRAEHMAEVRRATALPVLRKDFIADEHQVLEARALGADAVLLIVAMLEPARLRALLEVTREVGMEALVEAHDERELATALESGARIVGVNHRDLRTFDVDISLTERLCKRVPKAVIYVAESGIHNADDARRMRDAGADAVLVGEALMRAADVRHQLAVLAARR